MQRMSGWIGIVLAVLLVGGGLAWWYNQKAMEGYATFSSERLGVEFRYPKDWTVQEVTIPSGRVVGEVQIFGPRREDLQHSIYVDVAADALEGPVDLARAVEAAVAQRRKLPTYRVVTKMPREIAGRPAIEVESRYVLRLPLGAPERRQVTFEERIAYCLHGDRLYRLTYAAPAEDAEANLHAFTVLTRTLRFLP